MQNKIDRIINKYPEGSLMVIVTICFGLGVLAEIVLNKLGL